jgi:hypothetical protein
MISIYNIYIYIYIIFNNIYIFLMATGQHGKMGEKAFINSFFHIFINVVIYSFICLFIFLRKYLFIYHLLVYLSIHSYCNRKSSRRCRLRTITCRVPDTLAPWIFLSRKILWPALAPHNWGPQDQQNSSSGKCLSNRNDQIFSPIQSNNTCNSRILNYDYNR